jgi:serine/threonine protein kinase
MGMTPAAPQPNGSTLLPGSFAGEYQISHKLGEGGMGVVYAGMHPEIGKRVAIKVLAPHAAAQPDLIRRFKEEARSVNKIRHPHIIDIFAFNQLPDGRHYFVMEYLEGENLSARLARAPIALGEARRLLGQICSALEAAHEAGVVHRDLKPDNIWVTTEGTPEPRIKLLDFGIAKLNDVAHGKTTQAGTQLGTPHYMPPEQGMGREIDRRADIYALGVMLYEMFAGVLPFDGVTVHEIVLKHVTEVPLPPSRHRPIVPRGMEAIILACLEKAPELRPASAKQLWARIEGAFADVREADVSADLSPPPRAPVAESNRTQILLGSGLPGLTTPFQTTPLPPATTLRRSTGQLATPPVGGVAALPARRRRRWPTALAIAGAAAGAAVVYVRAGQPAAPASTANTAAPAVSAPAVTAPAVTAPPPVAAVPPAVASPATVTVRIDSLPRGARVIDESDGAVIGRTPFTASRARADGTLGLRLELDGFKPRAVSVPLGGSFDRTIELDKRPRATTQHHPSPPPAATPPAQPLPGQKKAPEIEWN